MKFISEESVSLTKKNYLGVEQVVNICMTGVKFEDTTGLLFKGKKDRTDFRSMEYALVVGVSIQNAKDEYKAGFGETIARDRSRMLDKAFMVIAQTKGGVCDASLRKVLLDNIASKELSYFSKSYAEAEQRFLKNKKKKEAQSLLQPNKD